MNLVYFYIQNILKQNLKTTEKHFISIIPEVGEVKLTTLENRNSKLHSKIDITHYSSHKPLVKHWLDLTFLWNRFMSLLCLTSVNEMQQNFKARTGFPRDQLAIHKGRWQIKKPAVDIFSGFSQFEI